MSLIPRRLAALAPACLLVLAFALAGFPGPWAGPGIADAALSNVRVDRPAFSPNGDGVRDSVRISWSDTLAAESLRVEIRPSLQGSVLIRSVAYGPLPPGSYGFTWDGRDSLGAIAPEAQYTIFVIELTSTGSAVPNGLGAAASILDLTPPPVPTIDEPLAGFDTTSAQLPVSGFAPGADSVVVYANGFPADSARVSAADNSFAAAVPLVEGPNTVAVLGYDRAGNFSGLSTAVAGTYRNTPDLTLVRAAPFEFSPNNDGRIDTTRLSLRIDVATTRLRVEVRPSVPYLTGTTLADTVAVVRLHDQPIAAGDHVFPWTGLDSTGTAVPDGNWYFYVQAESAGVDGTPHPGRRVTARMVVDRTAPPVPAPDAGTPTRTTRNRITLAGNTPGADSVLVARGGVVVARPTGARWSAEVSLVLGDNSFTFEAVDRAGNRSAISPPFVVTYEEPIGFHAPERFRAGDVFDVNVTRTARSVRIDLYELSGRRVRTLTVNQLNQRYELEWNLLDDLGRTVGDGPYVARATVSYEDGTTSISTAAVVVAK